MKQACQAWTRRCPVSAMVWAALGVILLCSDAAWANADAEEVEIDEEGGGTGNEAEKAGTEIDTEAEDDTEDDTEDEDVMMKPLTEKQLKGIHAKADADTDGRLSLQEILSFSVETSKAIAANGVKEALAHLDRNEDGALDIHEVKDNNQLAESSDGEGHEEDEDDNMMQEQEEQRFKSADANGDGLLQESELPSFFYPETDDRALSLAAAATVEAKDTDLDGKLTLMEFWDGDLPDGHKGVPITPDEEATFTKLDKNLDGFVDVNELKLWESGFLETGKIFQSVIDLGDKDGDGNLSVSELVGEATSLVQTEAQHTLMEWALHYDL